MADKDLGRGDDGPSLELPSFSLRRKRKKRAEPEEPAAAAEPEVREPATPEAPTRPAVQPDPEPVAQPAPDPDPVDDPAPDPDPVVAEPEPPTQPVAQPALAPEPPARPVAQPARSAPEPGPAADAEDTAVLVREDRPSEPARRRKADRAPMRLPSVAGPVAAALTGLVVGVLLVALSWGSQQGCAAIRGTTSCGKPGFFLLLAILVVLTVLGAYLLRAWGVRDAGSTSFLAVGLLTVVVLLFLVGSLFEWWMALVVPVVAVATYLTSHWVTTRVADGS